MIPSERERAEPIAELIVVRIKGKGRQEEFACLMGYRPPEGTEVISREPLFTEAACREERKRCAEIADRVAVSNYGNASLAGAKIASEIRALDKETT